MTDSANNDRAKIKRYTCVDRQSGLAIVDDGYVLGMLGPSVLKEEADGAWVKWEDVEKLLTARSPAMNITINNTKASLSEEKIVEALHENLYRRLTEFTAAPDVDKAPTIPAVPPPPPIYTAIGDDLDAEAKHLTGFTRLSWTANGDDPETDQEFRERVLDKLNHPQYGAPQILHRANLRRNNRNMTYRTSGVALDKWGELYGLKRERTDTEEETDTSYRRRILREISRG